MRLGVHLVGNMTRLIPAATRRHALAWPRGGRNMQSRWSIGSATSSGSCGPAVGTTWWYLLWKMVSLCADRGKTMPRRKLVCEQIVNECVVSGDSLPRGLRWGMIGERRKIPTSGARMMVIGASWGGEGRWSRGEIVERGDG